MLSSKYTSKIKKFPCFDFKRQDFHFVQFCICNLKLSIAKKNIYTCIKYKISKNYRLFCCGGFKHCMQHFSLDISLFIFYFISFSFLQILRLTDLRNKISANIGLYKQNYFHTYQIYLNTKRTFFISTTAGHPSF